MGLIRAAFGAAGSVLADQWKEFFYCESMPRDLLVTKGVKRIGGRSSNTKDSDNIISNGSGIAVADGQCMIIVEQGKVVEVCAEPGEFTFDSSTEPSVFAGSLGRSILDSFKTIGKRISYGGDTGKDQRVYYFNTKEIMENKFGTMNPVPFRVVDTNIGLDIDVDVRCSGVYSYKITDPLLFYKNVCGNIEKDFYRAEIDKQLKTEFISALQPGFGRISQLQIRPNQITSHIPEFEEAMNEALSAKWSALRGISVSSIAIGSVTLPEDQSEMIRDAQRTAVYRDPSMAAANLTQAQAEAMKSAAKNKSGAMNGFIGMGMAMNVGGGVNAADLYDRRPAQTANQTSATPPAPPAAAVGWVCPACSAKVQGGKFCPECGAKKPEQDGWTCSCGAFNKGKFCPECGARKPAGALQYRCDKCGWEPEKGSLPPKFCPECGDPFDNNDIIG